MYLYSFIFVYRHAAILFLATEFCKKKKVIPNIIRFNCIMFRKKLQNPGTFDLKEN